jgi:hypothetical protein
MKIELERVVDNMDPIPGTQGTALSFPHDTQMLLSGAAFLLQ